MDYWFPFRTIYGLLAAFKGLLYCTSVLPVRSFLRLAVLKTGNPYTSISTLRYSTINVLPPGSMQVAPGWPPYCSRRSRPVLYCTVLYS